MAGQPPQASEDDFFDQFFSLTNSLSAAAAGCCPVGNQPFSLALSLDAAVTSEESESGKRLGDDPEGGKAPSHLRPSLPPQVFHAHQSKQGGATVGPQLPAPRPKVRARRRQATDPHSIAERLRRERIAERMRALQELVPNTNKTDRAAMLDEILDYVKFLRLQVKCLGFAGSARAPTTHPLISGREAKTAVCSRGILLITCDGFYLAEPLKQISEFARLKPAIQKAKITSAKTEDSVNIRKDELYLPWSVVTQTQVLSMSRLGGAGAVAQLVADIPLSVKGEASDSGSKQQIWEKWSTDGTERHVAKLMEEDIGAAMQFLQSKALCMMSISLAMAIYVTQHSQDDQLVKPEPNTPS